MVWVKKGSQGKLQSNPGYHFRHAKEICLVCLKGTVPEGAALRRNLDVLISQPRLHSQKPDKQYKIMESLCPGGPYLELIGRRHNVRAGWITVGNQVGESEYAEGLSRLRLRGKRHLREKANEYPNEEETFTGNDGLIQDDTN